MTNATHIGNKNIGAVRGMLVAVTRRTDGRNAATWYVDAFRPEDGERVAPTWIFETQFSAI